MKHAILALALILCSGAFIQAQAVPAENRPLRTGRALTDSQWRQDLTAMLEIMHRNHKNLLHTVTEAQLDSAFHQLSSALPSLNDDEITVRLMQIAAMVRDGHSGIDVSFREGKTHVPIWIARYEDGLYIRLAAKEYPQAVGARITAIGGVPWQEVLRRVDTIVACDPGNDGQRWSWQPSLYLSDPLILHGLRLSTSNTEATYTLEKNGRSFDLTLRPNLNADVLANLPGPSDWLDSQTARGPQPLEHPWREPLAMAYVPDARAIYLQFNEVIPPMGESMELFAKRFAQFSDAHDAERLVIDLRHNPGGDNTVLRPLLVSLIRSKFNHRGGMFVLIGPTTFSAAQTFVDRLENYADVIFVGQPTSNNVNFYGDPVGTELPNSHLDVEMAHLWWQDEDPRDMRTATFPEIAVPQGSFADYVSGRDVALDFCLHQPAPLKFEDLMEAAAAQGATAAISQYQRYGDDPRHRYANTLEKRLNALGYKLLEAKETERAVVLFQVNADTHRDSANAFDSLGEGEEALGDSAAAILAYRKSLQLNPQNKHAQHALARLQAKP